MQLGLDTASDRDIWQYAGERGYVIVSKDSDFRQLAFRYGPPPKVVWLQVANATTTVIEVPLRQSVIALQAFADSDEESMLVLSLEA